MKRFYFYFYTSCILFFSLCSNAQHKSIHQEQSELYNKYSHYTEQQFDSLNGHTGISQPLKSNNQNLQLLSCSMQKVVFGWHPYWVGSVYNNYQWDKLTDLSFFSYEVDAATGNANSTHGWSTAAVIDTAKKKGVRVNLCVTLFSNHATFFGSSSAQQTLINNLINLVQQRGANGVNIDFEGVPSSQKTAFTNFMVSLSNQMHSSIANSQVSMALYAVDWNNVFDMATLNQYVDYFIIMGYDYYWSGSTTAGPNDPLYHFGTTYNYTLSKSITYYLNKGASLSKLILGLPYYGREYTTTSGTTPSSVLNPPNSTTRTNKVVWDNVSGNYSSANAKWDGDSYSPYFVFQSGGNWKQCFVNNTYSMSKRFDIVNQRGIGGIGIWALGYDDGYTYFWDLIRDKFTSCAVVSCTDTIYDMGGPNKNYYDSESYTYTISPAGATQVNLAFSQFDIEQNFDSLWIYNGSSTNSPLIGVYTGTNSPGTVSSTGGNMTIRFKSDAATNKPGYSAIWTCTKDNIPPTTAISSPGNWKTQDFNVSFTDSDNQLGIKHKFYQALDFDGTEWRANSNNGFFSDNFSGSAIHTEWTNVSTQTGTWGINNNSLNQSDSNATNPNIYALVNQNNSNQYLYHWQMKLGSSGTNQRAGIYFFCSDATQTQRKDAYMIYWRYNPGGLGQQVEIYKSTNNTISGILHSASVAVPSNTWFDSKVLYNPASGEIKIYFNNTFVTSWIDTSPLLAGNAISFRSGGTSAYFDDIKVYKSRAANTLISIGGSNKDIRYQNPNPSTASCRIKSLVIDSAENVSTIPGLDLNIDWTNPLNISIVNDGSGNDIDTTYSSTQLSANWSSSSDPNSGIAQYHYCVGTNVGDSDIVAWTSNGLNTITTISGLSLNYGQTYFISVKAENGAGLFSGVKSSDGILVAQPPANPAASFTTSVNTVCAGDSVEFTNTSINSTSYEWTFTGASPSFSTLSNPKVLYTSSGTHTVTLIAHGTGGSDTLTQNINITIVQPPVASFSTNPTSVNLPNATVSFTNNSNNATSYIWSFGDGNGSVQINPSYTYSDTGVYTITLIAQNSNCPADTLILQNYITVGPTIYPKPVASFIYGNTSLCINKPVNFISTSQNATTYQWSFSGGTPASSTLSNPSVIYSNSGVYNVTLIATGQGGIDSISQTINITIYQPPIAAFSANSDTVYLPNAGVGFINNSSNATTYEWNFGDGNNSSSTSPWHLYSDTGTYSVTLVAINGFCPNDTLLINNYITVLSPLGLFESINSGFQYSIFPNPAKEEIMLNVLSEREFVAAIEIINVSGQTIYSLTHKINTGETNIPINNIKHLSSGSYLLKINSGNSSNSRIFIKE